jgi:hypothetical protein
MRDSRRQERMRNQTDARLVDVPVRGHMGCGLAAFSRQPGSIANGRQRNSHAPNAFDLLRIDD